MTRTACALSFVTLTFALVGAQGNAGLIHRTYVEGDRVQYMMKGQNDGSTYQVRIVGTVKKGADGRVGEEYAWSDLISNNAPRQLSPAAQAFRMTMTLQGGVPPFSPPDLSKAPVLIGPITDLMTFYADLFLATQGGTLQKPGDHFYVTVPAVGSFADGASVLVGESAVDFDISLESIDMPTGVALLRVRHVPPHNPNIHLTAAWMRVPVADTPNNHVEVKKTPRGYLASVGKETFDVELRIALADGKILSATMDNTVTTIARECSDEALTQCGDAHPDPTVRHIDMTLVRD
jgi:hypothetical protein